MIDQVNLLIFSQNDILIKDLSSADVLQLSLVRVWQIKKNVEKIYQNYFSFILIWLTQIETSFFSYFLDGSTSFNDIVNLFKIAHHLMYLIIDWEPLLFIIALLKVVPYKLWWTKKHIWQRWIMLELLYKQHISFSISSVNHFI